MMSETCSASPFTPQSAEKHPDAKPLKGFGGAGVLEIVEDYDGDTYRAVYTVRIAGAIYVLHAFQKKAKRDRDAEARHGIDQATAPGRR